MQYFGLNICRIYFKAHLVIGAYPGVQLYKRFLHIAFAIAFSVSCVLMFSGCEHKADIDVISDSIFERLNGYKDITSSEVANFAARMDISALAQYGISESEFMEAYLDGFDYEIRSVELSNTGDVATATVVLKCKSFSEYENALSQEMDALKSEPNFSTIPNAELDNAFGEAVIDALEGIPLKETEPVVITFEKENNTWVPQSDVSADIDAAMISN